MKTQERIEFELNYNGPYMKSLKRAAKSRGLLLLRLEQNGLPCNRFGLAKANAPSSLVADVKTLKEIEDKISEYPLNS